MHEADNSSTYQNMSFLFSVK